MSMPDPFLETLYKEKLATQERRGSLIMRKLTWATGLLAAGSVRSTTGITLSALLYLVPFVATVFDLYITGENYGIKRIGAFVADRFGAETDGIWETWVRDKRDPFSKHALPLSSLVVLGAAAGGLWPGRAGDRSAWALFYGWLLCNVVLVRLVYVIGILRLQLLEKSAAEDQELTWKSILGRFFRFWNSGSRRQIPAREAAA